MQGTHQECFKAINQDSEIRSAEGVELALLAYGAYHADEQKDNKEWEEVKKLFKNNYIRVPARTLWIPQEYAKTVESGGVLVERDTQGNGLNTKMEIPNIKKWIKDDYGIYISQDKNQKFIPFGSYTLGVHTKESFAKDAYTISVLSKEGAGIFAQTVEYAGLKPWIWGVDIQKIESPEQRVSLLFGGVSGLYLGGDVRSDDGDYRAFGVRKKTGED
ncbi:MAG: hypothetical protein AABX65_04380 [Nanoarchaeota archaeon]